MFLRVGVSATLLTLSACGQVHTHSSDGKELNMSKTDFGQYLEKVFRHHNAVVERRIRESSLGDSLDSDREEMIEEAEEHMMDVCSPLNETVAEQSAGREADLDTRMQLAEAVPACEAATRNVESLMAPHH